ncbi:MAG: hypothetical protein H6667_07250 [Ardenticatenaceae bacterium]|nr:hypothetical protein [Ardenticatenaceae bacterium]MCB9444125.1 hypothetical protein [Ardenticatenaceae bacterium]
MPNNMYPDVKLRYEPDRSQRPVTPEAFAIPGPNADDYRPWDNNLHPINCPRCGADNRNWLHILNPSLDIDVENLNRRIQNYLPPFQLRIIGIAIVFLASVLFIFNNIWLKPQNIWFEITNVTIIFLILSLPFWFAPATTIVKIQYGMRKFGIATGAVIFTAIFMFMVAHFHFQWGTKTVRSLIMVAAVGLAGIMTTRQMLSTWLAQREYGYFTKIVPPTSLSQRISPPLKVWLIFTTLYLIIIPVLFYVIFPSGFYLLTTLGKPKPPEPAVTLQQRVNNILGELELVLIQAPPGTIEPAAEAIDDLVTFSASVPMPVDALDNLTLEQRANVVLSWTNDLLKTASEEDKQSIHSAITNLESFIAAANLDTAVSDPTTTPTTVQTEQPPWENLDKEFFDAWFTYVLAASIASLAFSLAAVGGYVRRINLQLPLPIYHSLANMTRVVVWEAKRALEIGDEVQQMQWTAVQRNNLGGIDLLGLYRDNHPLDPKKDLLTTRILAQHYTIKSDKWGKIVEAEIKAVRVWPQPGHFQLKEEEVPLGDQLFSAAATRAAERARP